MCLFVLWLFRRINRQRLKRRRCIAVGSRMIGVLCVLH
ncbi:Uncharacterised protein [Vibrio cholerae]|nr:Uncharacterised protein [Vibrio cholerae]